MKISGCILLIIFMFQFGLYAQYSETFSVPEKGYKENFLNDFTGVNWTMTNWPNTTSSPFFLGRDATNYFKTLDGKMQAIDLDVEVCWISPELTISGGTASFALDLSWIGFDPNADYIDVEYSTNGGSMWTPVPNVIGGGNTHTVEYISGSGTDGSLTVAVSGISGTTLQIRVCIDQNSSVEVVTLDNVIATNADVGGPPVMCDLVITNITVTDENCPNANDGIINISATSSNGPITYSITGPVSRSNSTGVFTGLPDGSYNILVRDNSFTPGTCDQSASQIINAGVDLTKPTASNPLSLNLTCINQIPEANPDVVTDEADNCTIPCTSEPWINEFHYDNDGTDQNEFIEIAGPAGINLSGYTIYTYDGSDGMVDQTFPLSGIIDDEQNGFGALTFSTANLQNQTEGIALVKNSGSVVIEFLSYEGSILALDGPALGLTSTDIGVSEPQTQTIGESLARIGSGNVGSEFTFSDQIATPGTMNANQSFISCPENLPTVALFSENSSGIGNQASPRVITRVYRVTDAAGNFKDVTHTINVVDATPPSITCPSNITVTAPQGQCSTVINFSTPTTIDNCGAATVLQTSGLASGSSFPVGTTTVIYEAEDQVGNTRECSFTVTVNDQEDPLIVCPANIMVNSAPGLCGAPVNYTPPVGVDNCPGATTSQTSSLGNGAFFPVGVTTEVYLVTDAAGNTDDCSFTVTVQDIEAPAARCLGEATHVSQTISNSPISLPSPFPLAQSFQAPSNGSMSRIDIEVINTNTVGDITLRLYNGNDPNNLGPLLGTVTRPSLNVNNAFVEFIVDNPVELTAGLSYVMILTTTGDYNIGTAAAISPTPNYYPNGKFYTKSINSPDFFVEAPVNDLVFQTYIVSTSAISRTLALDGSGNASLMTGELDGGSSDNCGITDLMVSPSVFSCTDMSVPVTVTLTVEDASGNSAACSVEVTVIDPFGACNQPPVAQCKNITVAAENNCEVFITAQQINDGSFDPDNDNLILSISNSGPFSLGSHQVELTVSDGSLQDKCMATVMVQDETIPEIGCPPGILGLPCDFTIPSPIDVDGTAFQAMGGTVIDNCSPPANITLSYVDIWGGTVCSGRTLTRSWTAKDEAGLSSLSCEQHFSFSPPTLPILTPPDLPAQLSCAEADIFTAPTINYSNSMESECLISGQIMPIVDKIFDKCQGGTITITYSTVDPCGQILALSPIQIDVLPAPAFLVGTPTLPGVLSCTDADAFDEVDAGFVAYSNNEPQPCLIEGQLSPSIVKDYDESGGKIYVTYSGTTECNITLNSITYEILVQDVIPPSIECMEGPVLRLENNCQISLPDLTQNVTISDNCTATANIMVIQDPPAGTLIGYGITNVNIKATDKAGNMNSCSSPVTVLAGTDLLEQLVCPADISVYADCASGLGLVHLPAPDFPQVCVQTSFKYRHRRVDNNNNPLTSFSPFISIVISNTAFAVGRYEIEWQVSDQFGMLNCHYYLEVKPVIPITPSILGPSSLCQNLTGIPYSISSQPEIANYQWSYSGTGVTIHNNGHTNVILDFAPDATSGTLSVVAIGPCGEVGPAGTRYIEVGNLVTCVYVNCLIGNIMLTDQTLNALGSPQIFKVSNQITSDATIPVDETIIFKAGNAIQLNPGFQVSKGGIFLAEIEDCIIVYPTNKN